MTLLQLFLTFMKIGVLGYGGGLAIIALVYDSIQQFGTISEEQFANWVAITQVTPGPVGLNIATFTGYGTAGIIGSVVATLGVAIPAFVIVSVVCKVLFKYMNSWGVQGALTGVRPATIGLVGTALVTLVKPAVVGDSRLGASYIAALGNTSLDWVAIGITAITVYLIMKKKMNPIIVLLIMGAAGAVLQA
ncbi:MAG: chromate transporter [Clostridiales bacterium]|nr:chromate transporter [Candidatus Crickella caballi]